MKSLTIAYTTARSEPMMEWFRDSLKNQLSNEESERVDIITVDLLAGEKTRWDKINPVRMCSVTHCEPKPNVWQGAHRITKSQWWAKSNALNTAICLAKGEWFATIDDRSVLMPGWLSAIKRAMRGEYAVCGSYEKRSGMTVENGAITNPGTLIGEDPRKKQVKSSLWKIVGDNYSGGGKWFGCTNALPLEWALQVNGYDESCDGMRYEDTVFGGMLAENKCPVKYDPAMAIVEDRTPGFDVTVKSMDKGVSPKDKSHALLKRVQGKKQATHHWNLRESRERVLRGEPFPVPDQPTTDWFDGMRLEDFP
jgi:hypothetical protein